MDGREVSFARLTGCMGTKRRPGLRPFNRTQHKKPSTISGEPQLDRSPLEPLDERVREAAFSTLPAPYVDSAIFDRRPTFSSVVGWVNAGVVAALIALTAGCLISLVDRMLGARRRQQHLLNLGISPAQLTRFGATMFAMPYAVATLVGFSTGIAICIREVSNPGIPMPWSTISVTLLAILGVGLLGTAAVSVLGTRDALREAE